MANLIIKPQNTSGDKVIIQDQAGGAVLTTADSGATIANATLTSPTLTSPTLNSGTLNSPTLVTPALGTPASGTLTNATFPAGHILDVKYVQATTGNTSTNSPTYTDLPGLTLTITPKYTSSKIFITAFVHAYIDSNGTDAWRRTNFGIHQAGSGVSDGVFWESAGGADHYSWASFNMGDNDRKMSRTPLMCLTSPSTTSAVTYKIQFRGHSSFNILYNAASYGRSEMSIMEVAG